MYWLVSLVKIALMLLLPALMMNTDLSIGHVLTSLAFIPGYYEFPILQVGWTLSFEMFFYCLFAIALLSGPHPVFFVSAALAAMTAIGLLHETRFLPLTVIFQPLLLEFVVGMM